MTEALRESCRGESLLLAIIDLSCTDVLEASSMLIYCEIIAVCLLPGHMCVSSVYSKFLCEYLSNISGESSQLRCCNLSSTPW